MVKINFKYIISQSSPTKLSYNSNCIKSYIKKIIIEKYIVKINKNLLLLQLKYL
jgi:hypothetical protein